MVQSAVIATGIFTLTAALGGAALSTATTLKMARRSEQRQEIQELRRERLRSYASFLTALSALETASNYLANVLNRDAKKEMADAFSWASRNRDRADHAFSELELFAGNQVREAAKDLLDLAKEHHERCRQGRKEVGLAEARRTATAAMQRELGIDEVR